MNNDQVPRHEPLNVAQNADMAVVLQPRPIKREPSLLAQEEPLDGAA
jgi:hypothetical protein